MPEPVCPECRAQMEPGILVDHTYGTADASEFDGPVETSFWTGIKLHRRERRRIDSFRRDGCGYLGSNAR